MEKRQYLKRRQYEETSHECCICQLTMRATPPSVMLPQSILKRKHYDKPLKLSYSLLIDQITTKGTSNHTKAIYRDTLKIIEQKDVLSQYHNFSSIVTNIKPFVLMRVQKDRRNPIHFHSHGYILLRERSRCHRNLGKGKFKKCQFQVKNGSGSSTDQEKKSIHQKYRICHRNKQSPVKDSQNVTLRRLTRNLSNMISKFQDNFFMNPSVVFELMDFVPGHVLDLTKVDKQQVFKKELDNISMIKEKKPIERLQTFDVPLDARQTAYGLPARGKIAQSRNLNLLKNTKSSKKQLSVKKSSSKKQGLVSFKENVSPNQRVHTQYESIPLGKQKKSISSKKYSHYKSPGLEKGKSNSKKNGVRLSRKV